jgi:hypothetical protein
MDGAMGLTEKELRDRGIRRSGEEVEEDARRFALHIIASLPMGRGVTEPAREFSREEAAVLEEGGWISLRLRRGRRIPWRAQRPDTRPCSLPPSPPGKPPNCSGPASRVRQRLKERTLYGVKAGRENRLPAFQF